MNAQHHRSITEADIQAYADGQIAPGTEYAEAVEAFLAGDPGARARLRAYARQDEAIRERYRDVLAEPLPGRLRPETIRTAGMRPAGRHAVSAPRLAAGLVVLCCAVALGWLIGLSAEKPLERFADRVSVHLAESDDPSSSGDPETLRSLSALGGAPDFSGEGLELVGARRVNDEEMYEAKYLDSTGRELRLMMAPDPQRHDQLLSRTQQDGRKVVYWKQGPLMYALTGDFSERDLDGFANVAIKRFMDRLSDERFAHARSEPAWNTGGEESIEQNDGVIVSSDAGAETRGEAGDLSLEPIIGREPMGQEPVDQVRPGNY